ncbi:DUF805 domain-containing protein [Sphingopyxis yananensis]|uniref:DUF805 domain-containing protein n=1 Tax=Sphingopyxis yananensis TaxID=2886687 RepID=UPI001D12932F|nr:DUF805 domain-containing protein [Sphingopyxis yananensis]MCC2602412.1 DUF805 domain-containing protein [Sphingopyxis yananensis]
MIDEESLKNIERLHQLKNDGVIASEDFDVAKDKILQGKSKPKANSPVTKADSDTSLPADDDYVAWALLPLRRYADFTGRSTRKEFWMFMLGCNIVTFALVLIALADTNYGHTGAMGNLAFGMIALTFLGVIVPLIAAQVRRLHDQDRTGFLALFNLIPYLGFLIVLAFMCVPGTEGENTYGPDPKQG